MTKWYLEQENLDDWKLTSTTAEVRDKQEVILNNNYSILTYSAKMIGHVFSVYRNKKIWML